MNNLIEKKCTLGNLLMVDYLHGNAFTGEGNAHTFRITVYDQDGQQVQLTGSVNAKLVNAVDVTVSIEGDVDENGCAVVTLSSDCYDISGRFILTIWADTTVIYCGVGSIMASQTDIIEYPTARIPDVQELIDQLQAILGEIPADISAIEAAGTAQVAAVNSAGSTQVAAVNSAGATQVAAVNTAGQQARESIPSDYSTLSSDVSELKSATRANELRIVDELEVDLTYRFVTGYRVATGDIGATTTLTPVANSNFAYLIVDCAEYDKFIITATGGATYRPFVVIDNSNKVILASAASVNNETVIVPQGGVKLISNANIGSTYSVVKKSTTFESVSDQVDDLRKICGLGTEIVFTTNYYINNAGNNIASSIASPSQSNSWEYAVLPCVAGNTFYINANSGTNPKAVTFVDASYKVLLRYDLNSISTTAIAPTNTAYIVINKLKSNTLKSYVGTNTLQNLSDMRPFYSNLIMPGKNNMAWSMWRYPEVVNFKRARDKVYWGYTTSDGYKGVAEYNKETHEVIKNHLGHSSQIDDHNAPAVFVYEDGTILCAYASGHDIDYYMRVRVSKTPESIEDFNDEILLPSIVGYTAYAQLIFYDEKLYMFYRVGQSRWAYRYTSDKGSTWSDEIVLITSSIQYYCKFTPTTTDGIVRICMYSNPALQDPKIRQAFLHLDTGVLYNSDNLTSLGTSDISKDNISVLIDVDTNFTTQRLLDVAITAIDHPLILYAPFSTGSNSIYRIFDSGTVTDIISGGPPLIESYMLGASWIGTSKIVAAYGTTNDDNITIFDYANGATTINETLKAEARGSIPIRNARPIADVDGKCILWLRGYYGSTYTDFNMDAEVHMLSE